MTRSAGQPAALPELRDFPKNPRENLIWRRKLLFKCSHDKVFRAKVKELFHRDILFAFNAFFFTLDVRKRPLHNQPFCTYGFQDEALLMLVDHINRGEDLPIEKSRDMGASWMIVGTFVWFWLNPAGGADFLMGSRIEDYVDKKGDMRTLFEKARYLVYKLPRWLWPRGFSPQKHDNFMRLTNPETGASITGESNNANFSTGGRYAAVLFDEFAKWESTDVAAWTAAGDATPCRIPNSTPFGAAGQHYDLVTDVTKKKLVMHWSKHNDKCVGLYCVWPKPEEAEETIDHENWVGLRSQWYDLQCKRRSSQEIAQELDIDYIGAGSPVFDGKSGKRVLRLLKAERLPVRALRLDHGETEPQQVAIGSIPREGENCLLIYEEPREGRSYVVAIDVAEGGENGDWSIVKVKCRETGDCVASYFTHHDEVQLALAIKITVEYYTYERRYPWWAVEANGPGLAVFDLCVVVHQLPNAFMMPTFDTTQSKPSYRKGWWTSTSSRRVLVTGLKEWLLEAQGWVDKRCVKEMITFIRNKAGKPEAKHGCNDDEVMCWGICHQVDAIVPVEVFEEPAEPDENTGLPVSPFDAEKWAKERSDSIMAQCLAQAEAKQNFEISPEGLDSMII